MTPESRPPRFSLVLPTYNEAGNIEGMVRALEDAFAATGLADYEIVIVDDDSPDGTSAIADSLAGASAGRVRSVHRKGERGLATAVVAGWKTSNAPVLSVMDADGQHPPEVMPRLLEALERGADVAVASRYTAGGDIPRWNVVRRLGSKFATFLVRLALPRDVRHIRDPLSGCFALRREVIEGVELKPLGFKILLEVLLRGRGRRLEEVPFVFAARGAGKSKLGARVAILDAVQLLRSSWQGRRERSKVKGKR